MRQKLITEDDYPSGKSLRKSGDLFSRNSSLLAQAVYFQRRGNLAKAAELCELVIEIDPDNEIGLQLLAANLSSRGLYSRAEYFFEQAVKVGVLNAEVFNNRGSNLRSLGRISDALVNFDKAIEIDATFATAHFNRGNALKQLGRFKEALLSYNKAIAFDPKYVEAYNNFGNLLRDCGRPGLSLEFYKTAINLRPSHVASYNNLGVALDLVGSYSEAQLAFLQALDIDPENAEIRVNRAMMLLRSGDYESGWVEYEWRLKMADSIAKHSSIEQPLLTVGSNVSGRRVYITTEQGFGDVIHFARYIPMLLQLGATVVLEAPKPLISVLETLDSDVAVVPVGSKVTDFDNYCPVMSLPYIFETNEATIPSSPYLFADRKKVKKWQKKLGPSLAKRVGLVWSGNAAHKNDHNRSIDLQQLMSLLEVPVEWHSLQKEYRAGDSELLERCALVREHQEDLTDFSDTAALIQCLDLVITVDTSVAHLAGALGKPVWILLPATPDYRWMLDRDDSPWYPSARLFRQPSDGGWGVVVNELESELKQI